MNEQTSSPCALRIPQFCTGIHFSCHCYNSKQQQQQQRNSQALTSLWSERRISSPRSHALWRIRDPHRHHFSRLRCNNNMKIFCYNTHTHKQKKSSTVYIWHRNTKTLKVFPPPTTETKTVYPQRERERGEDGERERERERVCECVLEEAVVSSLYNRCRWHLRTYFWANLPRSLIILSTAYISPARHRCEEEAQLQQQRYAKTVLIRCSFT